MKIIISLFAFICPFYAFAGNALVCQGELPSFVEIDVVNRLVTFQNSVSNPLEGSYRVVEIRDQFILGTWQHSYYLEVPYVLVLNAPNNGERSSARLYEKNGKLVVGYHRCE